ncbi:DUF1572 family protein [Flavobacterium sp. XGLA_31]|uniref:DUF1572 family protein n=1 Tax=Flavobacterium sp. XGLA_31 TaxID=3447666 RepID=UPI003F2A3AC9
MNNQSKLANRFREVILNGTWIANTNFKNELQDMDWTTATEKVQNLNTIAVLAQHIHYYVKGVKNVFLGGNLEINDRFSFDFPEMNSAADWKIFLDTFWKDAEEFAALVEKMPEKQLSENFVEEKYGTYLRNIDAMIEHSYYHLGQIVILKKMLKNQS